MKITPAMYDALKKDIAMLLIDVAELKRTVYTSQASGAVLSPKLESFPPLALKDPYDN